MRISYNSELDTLTIVFLEGPLKGKNLDDGLMVGFSANGKLAGLQIQDAAARFGGVETLHQIILEGMGS